MRLRDIEYILEVAILLAFSSTDAKIPIPSLSLYLLSINKVSDFL